MEVSSQDILNLATSLRKIYDNKNFKYILPEGIVGDLNDALRKTIVLYMVQFFDRIYCPNCGAKMDGK
jgi:hypothetical protein